MKAFAPIAALLLAASTASAQTSAEPALPHADVQAAVGWQNLRSEPSETRNDWINSIALADAAVGWYWTEHLRTQIDAGMGTAGRAYRIVQVSTGTPNYRSIETEIRPTTFGVSQQYQFFHNAVFHPHVGAGLLVRSERLRETFSPLATFNPATGQSVLVDPGHTELRSRTRVAALADVGFKAYVSQRAFFATDARFAIRRNVDGVLFRFGFGIDF